jgi:hypothetical protein
MCTKCLWEKITLHITTSRSDAAFIHVYHTHTSTRTEHPSSHTASWTWAVLLPRSIIIILGGVRYNYSSTWQEEGYLAGRSQARLTQPLLRSCAFVQVCISAPTASKGGGWLYKITLFKPHLFYQSCKEWHLVIIHSWNSGLMPDFFVC